MKNIPCSRSQYGWGIWWINSVRHRFSSR